jgi:hypothetical protein
VAHLYEDLLEGVEARKLTGGKLRVEITQQLRSPMVEAQKKLVCPVTEGRHDPKLDVRWSGKKLERVFQPIEDPCSVCYDKFHGETSDRPLINSFLQEAGNGCCSIVYTLARMVLVKSRKTLSLGWWITPV